MADPRSNLTSRLAAGVTFLAFSGGLGALAALVFLQGMRKEKKCKTLKIHLPKPSEEFTAMSLHSMASWRLAETLAVHIMPLDVESCGARLTELLAEIAMSKSSSSLFDDAAILGLDCEWQPETSDSGPHRLSVIQVSSLKHCFIFRPLLMTDGKSKKRHQTATLSEEASPSLDSDPMTKPSAASKGGSVLVPHELRDLLEDPSVIKAGVGILEDVRRLKRDLNINVKGALEIRLATQVLAPHHLRGNAPGGTGLQSLALSLLGIDVDKSMQCSPWHHRHLSQAQLAYAAQDAWLSRQMAVALLYEIGAQQHASVLPTLPSPNASKSDNEDVSTKSPSPLQNSALICFGKLLDTFSAKSGKPQTSEAVGSRPGPLQQKCKEMRVNSMPTRKSELYENCRLMAPDGAMLCTCSQKKAMWYIERSLADKVCEEPLTVKLRFEPQGRESADEKYYLAEKENRCCVCGKQGEFLRHHVVPNCYRSRFPVHMKSHLSHDIVLLCQQCHAACNVADHKRMIAVGEQYNAPVEQDNHRFRQDFLAIGVKSAARALRFKKDSLPLDRRSELEGIILKFFGATQITDCLLEKSERLDPKQPNEEWRSHASIVVDGMGEKDIEDFVRGWRRHFLETMQPKYLPPHWDVNSRVSSWSRAGHDV